MENPVIAEGQVIESHPVNMQSLEITPPLPVLPSGQDILPTAPACCKHIISIYACGHRSEKWRYFLLDDRTIDLYRFSENDPAMSVRVGPIPWASFRNAHQQHPLCGQLRICTETWTCLCRSCSAKPNPRRVSIENPAQRLVYLQGIRDIAEKVGEEWSLANREAVVDDIIRAQIAVQAEVQHPESPWQVPATGAPGSGPVD